MGEGGATEGFWRTIPGILTAAAGIVSAVGGLVIALSQAGLIGARDEEAAAPPAVEAAPIGGVWSAQVVYPWGTHQETFELRVEGGRLYGRASYLGTPRAIEDGTVTADRVTFSTRAEQLLGSETTGFQNRYDGAIGTRGIQFELTDTRGNGPIEFTAVRRAP
jgi:hypothetical protein